MPSCIHCNRLFVNREALHQHVASSSVAHPFCEICDRRFISEVAREAHMLSKHPPTFDCTMCARSFASPGALNDHYRGSVAHPNCSKCGKGFKDSIEHAEHRRLAHIMVPCGLCGGVLFDQDAPGAHYKSSPNHPSCLPCDIAFRDRDAYIAHIDLVHSGQKPLTRSGEGVTAPPEVQNINSRIFRDALWGTGVLRWQEGHSRTTSEATTTESRISRVPYNSEYPSASLREQTSSHILNEQPFSSKPLARAPNFTQEHPQARLAQSSAVNNSVSTLKQPGAPRIPVRPLPPPGDAMKKIWGTYENIEVGSTLVPPRFSRQTRQEAQPRESRLTTGNNSAPTGYVDKVMSWRTSNEDRLPRLN